MGRLRFRGPAAGLFLDRMVTSGATDLVVGQVRYGLLLNESAGTLDDVLVYRLADHFAMVVNASNRMKVLDWFERQRAGLDVRIEDETTTSAMIAVQGPLALDLTLPAAAYPLRELGRYTCVETQVMGQPALVSRTGYTGEDGVEIITTLQGAGDLWDELLKRGSARGMRAAGLGARDTLRLEAGMPLYGHELSETIDPVQAGLSWAAKGLHFVGRDALAARDSQRPVRVGLVVEGRRIPREGMIVLANGNVVGSVTSGTFSPTLQSAIAMAYVDPSFKGLGTPLAVDVRSTLVPAVVTRLPFYKRQE
jgi:aminomethyltransferase